MTGSATEANRQARMASGNSNTSWRMPALLLCDQDPAKHVRRAVPGPEPTQHDCPYSGVRRLDYRRLWAGCHPALPGNRQSLFRQALKAELHVELRSLAVAKAPAVKTWFKIPDARTRANLGDTRETGSKCLSATGKILMHASGKPAALGTRGKLSPLGPPGKIAPGVGLARDLLICRRAL